MTQQTFEKIYVHEHSVFCNGGGGTLGHPKIYLHLDASTHQVTCPYCSRLFVLAGHDHTSHAA